MLVETVKDPDSEYKEGNKVEEKKKKEEKDGGVMERIILENYVSFSRYYQMIQEEL